MTNSTLSVLNNSALCVLPLLALPSASVTAIGGPCAGVRGVGSGLLLLGVALSGVTSVVVGWVRWIRTESASLAVSLAKIGTMVVGAGAIVINAFFALFSGLQLIGMAMLHLRGY
jgi:hypothetical protein